MLEDQTANIKRNYDELEPQTYGGVRYCKRTPLFIIDVE
jgi:hypothetical protein